MEQVHRLHHRAVAARRNAPAPAPALYNILARGRPRHPTASLSFPTDPVPPVLGQAPSSLIAPFFPSVIPTINPLSGILPTIPHTDTPAPSKPTTGLSSTSPVETDTPAPVLNTTSSPISQGANSTTLATTTSSYSLPPQVPTVVTQVVPPSSSTSALNNNNNNNNNNTTTSTSQTSGATTSSGSVAAGVVVGLVGACAMVVFLVFLVRRKLRKPHDDFDATDFRRSAILMHDPPAHEDVVARGYNPRPPTMIERKMASIPAVTYGNMYKVPPAGYYNPASGPDNQAMFAGGQLGNSSGSPHTQVPFTDGQLMNPFVSAPPSPGSFATAGHSQSSNGGLVTPKAPYIMKPPLGPRRTSRPATGSDPGAANGFTFPQRQGSRPGTAERQQEQNVIPEQVPSDDYVDLSRSSVSSFQAAQYEAISRKLATDVPRGFDDVDVTSVMAPSSLEYIDEAPPVPPKSPFEDPEYAAVQPSTESDDDAPPPVPSKSPFEDPAPEHETEIMQDSLRESYTSYQTLRTPELLDFPVPPSPALTLMSRHRVDSWPPTLPELKLDLGLQGTQPLNAIKWKSAAPKYSSSPLAANDMTMGDEVGETGMPLVLSTAEATHKSRPDTVYDPADAYGGI
ncbi:hypothetical protein JOM56_007821 [Amanita muscaria]